MLLGAVPYINAIPLLRGLDCPVRQAPPAALDRLLKLGEVDVATAPITSLFENPNWCALPGVAIGTKKAARSVTLFTRTPELDWENIRSIYVDVESRTSASLLRVLLALKYQRNLKAIQFVSPLPTPDIDAKLIIGDKALHETVDPAWSGNHYDLGLEWTEWTDLPFVFACWTATKHSVDIRLVEELRRRVDRNLQELEEWCGTIEGYDASLLREYFTENMNYGFGRQEQQGMMTFYQHLRELDIYQHPFELRFVNP